MKLALWALIALQAFPCGEALAGAFLPSPRSREALAEPAWAAKQPISRFNGAAAGLLQAEQTPVSSSSLGERFGDAFFFFLFGLFVVIPFAISLLWINESRSAQLEAVLAAGAEEALTVQVSREHLPHYDGMLVHLNSEKMCGVEPVQDKRFPSVKMGSGCIRLRSMVEVYQWSETIDDESGTCSYSADWSSHEIHSAGFKQPEGHGNIVDVRGMTFGSSHETNRMVKYGESYKLPTDMVEQLNNYTSAEELVGATAALAAIYGPAASGNHSFVKQGDWYHCPAHGGQPQIGDCRAKFEYILDGPATVLALQIAADKGSTELTFGPYRSVPMGFCGAKSADEVRHLRIEATKKTAEDIFEESKCPDSGPFVCLCGCCNLVNKLFAASTPPQIYHIWPDHRSKEQCLASEESAAKSMRWGIRLSGWILLWIGVFILFAPLTVFADSIPVFGSFLAGGISAILFLFTFLLTLVIASSIVSLAYIVYHPLMGALMGIIFLLVSMGVIGALAFLDAGIEFS